jgi:hypothetical protein
MEQGAMRNVIVSFFLGFVVAQAVWWFAAGESFGAAAGGGFNMRFALLDGVEVIVACACFAAAVALGARGRGLRRAAGALLVALVAGAATSTITAPPSALTPRLLAGDGQFLVDIIAAAIVSAFLGWIVASAFGVRPAAAQP